MSSPVVIHCSCGSNHASPRFIRKAGVVPDLMNSLWGIMDSFSKTLHEAWLKALIVTAGDFRIGSISALNATLRRINGKAKDFTSSPVFDDFNELIEVSYAVGCLITRARHEGEKAVSTGWRVSKKLEDVPAVVTDFDFNLENQEAITQLKRHMTLWIRDSSGVAYRSASVEQAIKDRAEEMLSQGLAPELIGEDLFLEAERLYGVGTFAGKSSMYWGGVVDYAGTLSAVRGQLDTMAELGITRYEIVNPMDERTTPICQQLNGKVFLVSRALSHFTALDGATSIDEVKEIKGFTGNIPPSITLPTANDSASVEERSRLLEREGLLVPPFHFRCRSFLDISEV